MKGIYRLVEEVPIQDADAPEDFLMSVDRLDHGNIAVYGPGNTIVSRGRAEFYSLPSVREEIIRAKTERDRSQIV